LSGGVQGFLSGFRFDSVFRFQISRIPVPNSAFLKGLLWARAAGPISRLRRSFAIEAVPSWRFFVPDFKYYGVGFQIVLG
jgi:hypothetical protein